MMRFVLLLTFLFLSGSIPAYALTVQDIRVGVHTDKTRLVLDLNEKSDFRAFVLGGPPRLVVDLPSFTWRAGALSQPKGSPIRAVRQGTLQEGISRIVFDLGKNAVIQNAFTLPRSGGKPDRLVLDFSPASTGTFAQERDKRFGTLSVNASPPKSKPPPSVSVTPTSETLPARVYESTVKPPRKPGSASVAQPARKPLIILDPGHGGADPGASAANGLYEKHIVLSMAKELKRQLESSGRYRVKLTRTNDRYIRLSRRVAIAREQGADLFVSIHADAINKRNVRGASVYTLSEKASDAQTAKLAARENRSDIIAGVDLDVEDKLVADILVDLAMRDTMNQSNFFANTVVSQMRDRSIRTLERPHRHAGFAVLKAPDIPSVLIEIGFLSNPSEARLISGSDYQRRLAKSLVASINSYFHTVQKNHRL